MRFRQLQFLFVLIWVLQLQGQQAPAPQASSRAKPGPSHAKTSTPDTGSITEGVYHNSYFSFTYKLPFGGVDRTEDMQAHNQPAKGLLLLAIFERPPEAQGETVNSAVIIAAEQVASYPGLKSAADYFEPLTELTTGKGFKVVYPPYEFVIGGKQLVRGDFSKDLGKLTMQQASLVEIVKGYIVSFTFLGGSGEEVDSLVERLSFAGGSSGKGPPSD
jgi:hypothetical protein